MKIVSVACFLLAPCVLNSTLVRYHFFVNKPMAWSAAQSYCRQNYDDLSVLDTQEEIQRFKVFAGNHSSTESWIGLSKNSSSSDWTWSDGSAVEGLAWAEGQPNTPKTDFCAMVLSAEFYDFNCQQACPFFCYQWSLKLYLVNQSKSWEDAFEYCKTNHNALASLSNWSNLIQTHQLTSPSQTPSVWTGLRFLVGSWFWVSGAPVGNLVNLPVCPANFLFCGSRNLKTESWENRDCSEKLNFLCY